MAKPKPMGCVTLFCVIVAAIVVALFAVPAACTTAGTVAVVGAGAVAAEAFKAAAAPAPEAAAEPPALNVGPPAASPAPASAPTETGSADESIAAILRSRVRWPASVTLTRDHQLSFGDGELSLEAGRTVTAYSVSDDGLLSAKIGSRALEIPFYDTDILSRMGQQASHAAPLAPDRRQQAAIAASLAAPKRSPLPSEQRLIDLKKEFPAQTKHRVIGRKGGTFEIDVPAHAVHSYYRGMVQIATLDSLPRVLPQLEQRRVKDAAEWRKRQASLYAGSELELAEATANWLERDLPAYLEELRQIR